MTFDLLGPPTGLQFIRGLSYVLAFGAAVFMAALLLRRVSNSQVVRILAAGLEFMDVAFVTLIGIAQFLPHNHGHVRWLATGSAAMNHTIESLVGIATCGVAVAAHWLIWKRSSAEAGSTGRQR